MMYLKQIMTISALDLNQARARSSSLFILANEEICEYIPYHERSKDKEFLREV